MLDKLYNKRRLKKKSLSRKEIKENTMKNRIKKKIHQNTEK